MTQLLKVRPTKIEFIKLKRRLVLAERVQKIMKEKISLLTLEFLKAARETVTAKSKVLAEFAEAHQSLSIAQGYHGGLALDKDMATAESHTDIGLSSRSIAGVRIPAFQVAERAKAAARGYNLADTSSLLDHASDSFRRSVDSIIKLAELQRGLELLGMEISRTRRIVNALEYFVIPSLQATIRFLSMKFEEQGREEKSRLKRVKVLLERK